MLPESIKERIYDSINNSYPITFTIKDESEVEHSISYSPVIVRGKDTQPASFPAIILTYKGGHPKQYIGTIEMGDVITYSIADTNGLPLNAYVTVDNDNSYTFTIQPLEGLLQRVSIYTSLVANSNSGLDIEYRDEEGSLIANKILKYYELTDGGYTTILDEGLVLPYPQKIFNITIGHWKEDDDSTGVDIGRGTDNSIIWKNETGSNAEIRGYFYKEKLNITVEATHDETQTTATHVQGYFIVNQIYSHLHSLIIDWRNYPEADIKRISEPINIVDEEHVGNFLYSRSFDVTFEFIGGVVDSTPYETIKSVKIGDIRLIQKKV